MTTKKLQRMPFGFKNANLYYKQLAIKILIATKQFHEYDIRGVFNSYKRYRRLKREFIKVLRQLGFNAYQLQHAFNEKDKRNIVKELKVIDSQKNAIRTK